MYEWQTGTASHVTQVENKLLTHFFNAENLRNYLWGVSGESRCCEVVLLWLRFRSLLSATPSAAPRPLLDLPHHHESVVRKCLPLV